MPAGQREGMERSRNRSGGSAGAKAEAKANGHKKTRFTRHQVSGSAARSGQFIAVLAATSSPSASWHLGCPSQVAGPSSKGPLLMRKKL